MANGEIEKVFYNDYIMTHILRMLDLKQQLELQKICERLRFLMVTCVWRRDCKEMQIYRNQMISLTDDGEYFELLQLNAGNIQKLTVDAGDGGLFQMYFPARYENLLQLHIKCFQLRDMDFLTIVRHCPQLQLLDYDEDRATEREPARGLQLFVMLWSLTHLRVLILQNLDRTICHKDLYLLATKVPLERLEVHNVRICASECDSESYSMDLPGLKVLKMDCSRFTCKFHSTCLEFVRKCQNLHELQIELPNGVGGDFFENFKYLERIQLSGCNSKLLMWHVIRNIKLVHLDIEYNPYEDEDVVIAEDTPGIFANLQNLKVTKECPYDESGFWLSCFQSPLINCGNLQELSLANEQVSDEFMGLISMKCYQLKILHLDNCGVSGKYINLLPKLQKLTIIDYWIPMQWSNLYSILKDLKFLKYLELGCHALTRGNFSLTKAAQIEEHLANSLEILKICGQENNEEFWEYISNNCPGSFQSVHTLHLVDVRTIYDYDDLRICTLFKRLTILQLEASNVPYWQDFVHSFFYDEEEVIKLTFKHLICIGCTLYWKPMLNTLKLSNVEVLEFYDMIIEDSFDEDFRSHNHSMDDDIDIFKNTLRKISITYDIFQVNSDFWKRCLEKCVKLQLCCVGHSDQRKVIKPLFENSTAMQKVRMIHANKGLYSIKSYFAENNNSSQMHVRFLNEDNKQRWNPRYNNKKCVIIIET